nr:MAG TPA: hypothetical protein [Caudoviricetes sp.]
MYYLYVILLVKLQLYGLHIKLMIYKNWRY